MDDSDRFGTDDLLTKHSLAADFYANASPTISRYYALVGILLKPCTEIVYTHINDMFQT